jgi:hypothetical protein
MKHLASCGKRILRRSVSRARQSAGVPWPKRSRSNERLWAANFSYFAPAAPLFALLGDITPAWSSSHVILTKDPDPSKWGQ